MFHRKKIYTIHIYNYMYLKHISGFCAECLEFNIFQETRQKLVDVFSLNSVCHAVMPTPTYKYIYN